MAETASHTWACPSCGRRVPLRVEACHCGMTRARAEDLARAALAAAAPAAPPARRGRSRGLVDRREAVAAMTGDVRVLAVAGAIVLVAGLGWLVLGPSRPASIPAILGHVDQGPPTVPKPTPSPRPPFKLPWWK
jgi:hypothetical protein